MENNYEKVSNLLKKENIVYDKEKLKEVIDYCEKKYVKVKKADEEMINHVIGVATEVAKLRLDDTSIYASLLHGLVKCEDYDPKEVSNKFGKEILEMITTVDKLSGLNFKSKEKMDNENLRKMFMAIAKDIRTVIIKLADRLYNMRNIKKSKNEELKNIMARECLEVYAPIAHRLGMSQVKSELEDISFRILMPAKYQLIKHQIDQKKKEREEYIQDRIDEVSEALKKQNIKATIYGRPKHFYSIYKKMKQKNCNADDLFDLLAIRIIVDTVADCYSVLGIVHDMYKPMPGRFKDYIAVPKTNMYQSLHTTVFGENGKPFEIQIRTWKMHKIADYGVAAHFAYKEKSSKITEADKKIVWLRQTLEIQKELADTTENLKKMKVELFGEEVFVFTPKGDIKALPKGSTPIDFAYSIHQKIAEKMVGAKINSKMVPINTKLENTDIVEIVTSPKASGPNNDWLKYVKTASAKNKITGYLKKQGKQVNVSKGKEILEKFVRKEKVPKELLLKEDNMQEMLKSTNFKSIEDLYENIGFGSVSPLKIVNKLVEVYNKQNKKEEIKTPVIRNNKKRKDRSFELVEVENIDNCLVKFAKCCSPIPGDDIVGYITFSNGVSIHRKDCKNIVSLQNKERLINVRWKDKVKVDFLARITVEANNKKSSILQDVLGKLKELKVDILELNSKFTDFDIIIINVAVNIKDVDTLQKIIKTIKKLDGVYDVKRNK